MKNTLNFRVKNLYHVNQYVLTNENETIFQSYQSICAIVKNWTLTLGRHWDYSHTTIRHLYKFLSDYCYLHDLSTKTIRKAIENWTIWNYKLVYDNDLV